MKASQGQGNSPHAPASPALGIGRRTSGEAGATLTHETMAETGGSGGSGMTGYDAGAPAPTEAGRDAAGHEAHSGTAMRQSRDEMADSGARGYQDTRSEQAGGTGTGLGTPETGANQNAEDLEGSSRRK